MNEKENRTDNDRDVEHSKERQQMGDKRFHSETSLNHIGEEQNDVQIQNDPGVHNYSLGVKNANRMEQTDRRRAVSTPGPMSGAMRTATAARAARRRPMKIVAYAADTDKNEEDRSNRSTNFLPLPSKGDESTTVNNGDRGYLTPNGNYRNGDVRSLSSYRMYATNSANTPRTRSMMDAQSIRSIETHAPPPTTPEQNKNLTSKHLTIIMSVTYAITLVTVGAMIFLTDGLVDYNISPIYCLILTIIGFIYLLILVIDIARYKRKVRENEKLKERYDRNLEEFLRMEEMSYDESNGILPVDSFKVPTLPPPVLTNITHDYCFSEGRHAGSFYLKMGATAFALGHLVHSLLLFVVQIGFLIDEDIDNNECVVLPQLVLDVLHPLYCFFQLFFIYKYSNVIIMKWQGLARFAFMHFIGSSISFWIWAIVRETLLSLTIYANTRNNYDDNSDSSSSEESNVRISPRFFDPDILYNENCVGNVAYATIYERFSPYLYPFSVEFNILIVAIYYIVWDHIGKCSNESDDNDDVYTSSSVYESTNNVCKIPTAHEDNDFTSNFVIHADCHASNRGLFVGMIVIVFIIGTLILGFVFSSVGNEFVEVGYLLNNSTKLSLHLVMLFGVIFAFIQTTKLDINEHPFSLLDDILLFICLPAFLMETAFTMVATINILNLIRFIDVTIMCLQIIIQTPLLVDGLRRCSNSRKLRRSKPGREILMFLLITNVAMWLSYTFSYKSPDSLDERYSYYGKVAWSVLGHICLPLIMFYRFHSSVCFADIWDAAYKPGSEH